MFFDAISLALLWTSPLSCDIGVTLQDVDEDVLGPDDVAKVLEILLPYSCNQIPPRLTHLFCGPSR